MKLTKIQNIILNIFASKKNSEKYNNNLNKTDSINNKEYIYTDLNIDLDTENDDSITNKSNDIENNPFICSRTNF